MTTSVNNEKNKKIIINKNGKRVEMIPPDGGWGYAICISLIITFVSLSTTFNSFGLLFNDFLLSIGQGTSGIAIMNTISAVMTSFSSIAATAALKQFSQRKVMLVSSVLTIMGFLLQVFMTNMYEMIISNVLIGIGFTPNCTIIYTAFNSYFLRKRIMLLSTCKAIVGILFMVNPLLIKLSMDVFGFRGTLLILTGIAMNSILACVLLQPVKWHLIEKEIEDESTRVMGSNIKINIEKADEVETNISKSNGNNKLTDDDEMESLTPFMTLPNKTRRLSSHSLKKFTTDRRPSMPATINRFENNNTDEEEKRSIRDHLEAVSLLSLSGIDKTNVVPAPPPISNKSGIWHTIRDNLDLTLLADPVYVNIAMGMSVCMFSEYTFQMWFPLMLFQNNMSKKEVAVSMTATGAGDMACRFMLAAVSRFFAMKPRNVFLTGALLALIFRIALMMTTDYYTILAFSVVIGVAKSMTHLMIPLVFAEHVEIEKYSSAYALHILMSCAINILFGPLIGIIRDMTGSYVIAIHILNAGFVLCIASWSIERIILRKNEKKKILKK